MAIPLRSTGDARPAQDPRICFVDALWSAYASGDVESLRAVTTEQGYEALLASDWRTRNVADGMLTFDEAARLRELNDFEDLCLDGTELVGTRLDMVVVIEPGGSLLADGSPIESSRGEQRTGLVATFLAPETADGAWLVDAIGPTAFETPYVSQRPARPRRAPWPRAPGAAPTTCRSRGRRPPPGE